VKTVNDILEAARTRLKGVLGTIPVGKMAKPVSATSEYVVVNSLPVTTGILQKGVVNINIHVKDFVEGANLIPNHERIDAITKLVVPAFDNVSANGISYEVESMHVEEEEVLKEHYQNVRVKFNVINL
jgi:hypothetical protein